ncbi:hypothetical protein KAW08_00175 [bacterium]|nr:hypothetical protein [bacterium]
MSAQITELIFLQQMADRFNIPVPEFITPPCSSKNLTDALSRWGGKGMVKPDVLTGKRGKAGAIKIIHNSREALAGMQKISSTPVGEKLPRAAYVVQHIPKKYEIYTAITYNSKFLTPSITVSLSGGVDVESIPQKDIITIPVDIYRGLDAYQASGILEKLKYPSKYISQFARALVSYWDMFISTGMKLCEINPWIITPQGKPVACDFKAVFDEANFKFQNLKLDIPEYPEDISEFEEEMNEWQASSHQGQAHVSDIGGSAILPILFGGGASTIITETLMEYGGDPIFLSDFGGNPPYERMYKTVQICFKHHLKDASLLLILGGKANNTLIDVTFKAIADALTDYAKEHSSLSCMVVIGRGGPHLAKGIFVMKKSLEALNLPHVIFGPDTPVSLVAEYAARLTI